jgi:hypothetical protein
VIVEKQSKDEIVSFLSKYVFHHPSFKNNFFWQMNEKRASGQKAPRQLSLEINSKGIVFAILFKFNPRSKNEFVRLKN